MNRVALINARSQLGTNSPSALPCSPSAPPGLLSTLPYFPRALLCCRSVLPRSASIPTLFSQCPAQCPQRPVLLFSRSGGGASAGRWVSNPSGSSAPGEDLWPSSSTELPGRRRRCSSACITLSVALETEAMLLWNGPPEVTATFRGASSNGEGRKDGGTDGWMTKPTVQLPPAGCS